MKTNKPTDFKSVLSAGRFFLLLVFWTAAFFLVSNLIPIVWIEQLIATVVSFVLELFSIPSFVGIETDAFIQVDNGPKIIINYLCTGIVETIILMAAILATFEIHWKKRVIGAIAAVIGIAIFNLMRILFTTATILTQPVEIVVLSHEVFFRIFLFVVIAGFYWIWILFAQKQARPKPV